jgi:hypothetical protein
MPEAVSFKRDIRPMFTDMDIEHMRKAMDLSSRDSVFLHAAVATLSSESDGV